jgi:hypothetical protein
MLRKACSILILLCYSVTFPVLVVTHVHGRGNGLMGSALQADRLHPGDGSTVHAMCEVCYRIDTATSDQIVITDRSVITTPSQAAATDDTRPPFVPAAGPSDSRGPPAFQTI